MVKLRFYIILILALKLTSLFGFNAISGGYLSYIDEENTVYLTLSDNNKYSLEIINETNISNDISFSLLISNGRYLVQKDKLELIDDFNGYKLYFEIMNKKLHSVNDSFIWLSNRIFNKDSNNGNIFEPYRVFLNENIKTHFISNKKNNSKHNTLYYENYKTGGVDFSFTLKLDKNNKATYSFRNLILLEGTFKRHKDNVRCVTDNTLKYPFYFLIYKNAVKPIAFPHNEELLHIDKNSVHTDMQNKCAKNDACRV